MKSEKSKKYIIQYVIYTFVLFVLLLLILGGIATVLFKGTSLVMRWLTAITAWAPTYIFLLMFKKLYPNSTVKDFYKKVFSEKLNIHLIITTTVLQTIIFASIVFILSVQRGVLTINLLDF